MAQVPEQEARMVLMNKLLQTPHRNLEEYWESHSEACQQDPLFYMHMAAWYFDNGTIRDHKEMFVANLCLAPTPEQREVGCLLLKRLPPFQVCRIVDFIHGGVRTQGRKKIRTGLPGILNKKVNIPHSMKRAITSYLREREQDQSWFDNTVLVARKALKRLYALLHIKPSDYAQQVLFDNNPPQDSLLYQVKQLHKIEDPQEQARIILENQISYRIASSFVKSTTPSVVYALACVMSDQELLSRLGWLQNIGALNNAQIYNLVLDRLQDIKNSKRIDALKAWKALDTVQFEDKEISKLLREISNTQVRLKGRITRPTALFIDKSGSMNIAIQLGKQAAAMISAIVDADFYVYAFDTVPIKIESQGKSLSDWEEAMKHIKANGATCVAAPLVSMRLEKIYVEQIIIITDEGENRAPTFCDEYFKYAEEMGVHPDIYIVRCGHYASTRITDKLNAEGVNVMSFDFTGADYYSLPNIINYLTRKNSLELLMEIINYPLPGQQNGQ